jgi:glycosyltransferase involved in cell wall biosynthesis
MNEWRPIMASIKQDLVDVAHLNSYYWSNSVHQTLVKRLSNRGIKQHIFLPILKGSEQKPEPNITNASYSVYPCFSKWQRRFWPIKMMMLWHAFEKDRRKNVSRINHAHTLIVNGLIAWLAKRRYGTPYVVTIRNTDVNIFLRRHIVFRFLARKIINSAEILVTISPSYWTTQLPALFNPRCLREWEGKHFLIPNGIDEFWFQNRIVNPHKARSPFRLLFVGHLDNNKNLSTLLDACVLLVKNEFDFELTVVGTGHLEKQLKEKATNLPVVFRGYISNREELLAVYRNSDLMVVPSRTESFGLVYAEALTQAKPVIYTRNQGFDGVFSHGEVGYAVDAMDANEISSRIRDAQKDYSRLSSNAHLQCHRFMWNKSVDLWLSVYTHTIKQRQNIAR